MQTEKRIAYEQVAGHLPKGLPYPPAAMFEHPLQAHYALEEQMSPAMMSMNPNSAWMAQRMSLPPAYSKMAWRKGKWLDEEEAYTKKLIEAFNAGYLNIPSGTTLRSFLSERLSCDPMRITKKFAGSSCIGKQVYSPCDPKTDASTILAAQDELKSLEEKFKAKVDIQRAMDYYPITPQAYAAAMQGHLPMMEALPAEYYAALHAQAAAPNPAYYSHYMNSMMKGYSPAELAALQNQMNPYYAAQQAKLPGATKYRDLTDLPYSSVAVPPVPHYPHDPSLGLNSLRMKPTPAMGKDSFEPNGVMLSQGLKSNLALGLGLESALMSEARFKNAMSVEQAKALLAEEELKRTRKYPMSYDGITNPLYMSTVPANKPSIVKDLKESKVKVEPLQVPAKEDSANDKEASDLLINFFKTAQSRDSLPEMLNEAKKAALVASSAESTEISSPVTDTEELIASSSDSSYIGKSGSEKSFEPSTSQSRRSLISLNDSSHDQFILSCQPPTQFLSTIDPAMLISNKRKLDANNSSLEEMQKKVKV